MHLHAAQLVRASQRNALVLGARGVDVAAKSGAAVTTASKSDQVGDAVAVGHGRKAAAALGIAQAHFDVAAAFGLQAGVAVLAKALVQRRRAKCRASRRGGAPMGRKSVAIGDAAGVLAAKLTVIVVAQVQLQAVRAGLVAITQGERVLRTAFGDGGAPLVQRRVVQIIFAPLQRGGEQVRAHAVLVLPQVAAQLGFSAVGRGFGFVAAQGVSH